MAFPQDDRLESRLRGLILNNNSGVGEPSETSSAAHQPLPGPPSGDGNGHARQQHRVPVQGLGQTHHRRPNQPQRRQMGARVNVPIDHQARSYEQRSPNPQYANACQSSSGAPASWRTQHGHTPYSYGSNYREPSQGAHWQAGRDQATHRFPSQPVHGAAYFRNHASNAAVPQPYMSRPSPLPQQLYQPEPRIAHRRAAPDLAAQHAIIESMVRDYLPRVEVDQDEAQRKEAFRLLVEEVCRDCIARQAPMSDTDDHATGKAAVQLKCFGSMSSGFATRASDMDLALLAPYTTPAIDSGESPVPRLLEKMLLDRGFGARLLTKTRVPIIKLCQSPPAHLLRALRSNHERSATATGDDINEALEDAVKPSDENVQASTTGSKTKKNAQKSDALPLRQTEDQTIGEYYSTAKAKLGAAKGKDLTDIAGKMSPEKTQLLHSVCKEFIEGLYDRELIQRLRNYNSIKSLFDNAQPEPQRSLAGLLVQVEGENLALAWLRRPLKERNEAKERACADVVQTWAVMQDDISLEDDLGVQKRMHVTLDKLRRISSIQLISLQQMVHEDAHAYYERVQKLLRDLSPAEDPAVQATIAQCYIKGVQDSSMKEVMLNVNGGPTSVRFTNLQHRALQMIKDYEYACKHSELYEPAEHELIMAYCQEVSAAVTSPGQQFPSSAQKIEADLIAGMRKLPDPSTVSARKRRSKYNDLLDFPKKDIGVQCDINFSADLALHNTQLLRCYSKADWRVRPMVLFIKHWAKSRNVNTPYRGTLSSYGYVLMVLHYLVNIATPFVCPNLQLIRRPSPEQASASDFLAQTTCRGYDVYFWRDEEEIQAWAARGELTGNRQSLGALIAGFFEYFAHPGQMQNGQRGFDWGREVLSLRTPGGILSKQAKGWTGARTVVETSGKAGAPRPSLEAPPPATTADLDQAEGSPGVETAKPARVVEETKEVRHRYLFAIEDPFETDHNVARTVTHNGIVAIRDELRRAWRIIKGLGGVAHAPSEGLLDVVRAEGESIDGRPAPGSWHELMDLLHGHLGVVETGRESEGLGTSTSGGGGGGV